MKKNIDEIDIVFEALRKNFKNDGIKVAQIDSLEESIKNLIFQIKNIDNDVRKEFFITLLPLLSKLPMIFLSK